MITTMANHSNGGHTVDACIRQKEQEKPTFHDFLGTKTAASASKTTTEPRLPMEKVAAASPSTASTSSGGGRGGLSSTSDLGSVERQGGNHLDGIQLFGPRSDISGSNMTNRLTGSKRSNSDSLFTSQESLEALHWAKMFRNGPRSLSTNVNNPLVNYPPRGGQISHLLHQLSSSRFKDASAGPSVISQTAADEGSRTGLKGPGILSPFNVEKNSSGSMPNGSKLEPFKPASGGSRKDLASSTRQMTIFYGGQAHVFDDVHPNKADVIMALAGSNGGSWSTVFSPKPKGKSPGDDGYKPGEVCEGGSSMDTPFLARDFRGRFPVTSNTSPSLHATASACDRILKQAGGGHQRGIMGGDARNSVQATEPGTETRREI